MLALHPQVLVNGLVLGTLHGCAALGLSLMLGTAGRVHLAYGHAAVVSALAGATLAAETGLTFARVAPLLALGAAAAGAWLHPARLWDRSRGGTNAERAFLLVGLGAALVLEDAGQMLWPLPTTSLGMAAAPWRVAGIALARGKLAALLVALLLTAALGAYLRWARNGKALRAWQGGAGMVELMGVSPPGLGRRAMSLGFALAGMAGAMLAATQVVAIQDGMALTVRWLCLAILVGKLAPWRVLAAGALLGATEGVLGLWWGPQWSPAVWYALLLAMLTWRARREAR